MSFLERDVFSHCSFTTNYRCPTAFSGEISPESGPLSQPSVQTLPLRPHLLLSTKIWTETKGHETTTAAGAEEKAQPSAPLPGEWKHQPLGLSDGSSTCGERRLLPQKTLPSLPPLELATATAAPRKRRQNTHARPPVSQIPHFVR